MQAILLLLAACGPVQPPPTPASPAPAVRVEVEEPWRLAHQTDETVTIRLGDSAEGVRIQVRATGDHALGTTPILRGRPMGSERRALASPAFHPTAIEVRSEGPDLLVRMSGPPLSDLTDHPDAPTDVAISWLRLRPRGETWRIVLDGLGTIALPDITHVAWTTGGMEIGERAVLTTSASRHRSAWTDGHWTFDTRPALEHADPYPRTAFTLNVD